MTEYDTGPAARFPAASRLLPIVLLLFLGSGAAALIYEIVWFQLLQLVIGSSAISLGVLLGTFMGGMCLGSLALPRFISSQRHPLRVYAALEIGIGILGLVVLFALPYVARIYSASAGHGFAGILLRGVVCAICLLPPTLLMGATLPAIARWIEMTPRGVSWLGFFYGSNIAGAVFGCLLAGFYLLRVHDMATATYVAATINALVALIGFGLAALIPKTIDCANQVQDFSSTLSDSHSLSHALSSDNKPQASRSVSAEKDHDLRRDFPTWTIYAAIALSGMCALGSEVVWTRLLSLLLGGTVYTFSIILAVFLIGLGIGSSIGSFLTRGTVQPWLALGCCQVLLTGAMAWTGYMLANSLPYWPVNPSLSRSPWFNFQIDLARCLWAVLPPTILWGASFPLALAAVAHRGQDAGKVVGRVYAANTLGAIIGALGVSGALISLAGTQRTQQILIWIAAAAAFVIFAPRVWQVFASRPESADPTARSRMSGIASLIVLPTALGIAVSLGWSVPKTPWELIAHGRYLPTKEGDGKLLFMGEGMNASVAVTETSTGIRNFHVSGKIEASSEPQDMRLQRMLGHLPALLHPKPRSVLIVGCGAGVTAGSFVVHPDIERIVICEIEPLIPTVVATHFGEENYHVVNDPRVKVIFDDARHYVLTTDEKFDIITSDPIHPWVKGAATLYTKEYFEMCKQRLNPGGLVTQWVPLYESNPAVVKSEIATFFDAFPNGTIWSNDQDGEGYDVVLLGQSESLRINVDEIQERLDRQQRVARSLRDVGIQTAVTLFATYAGRGSDLQPWLEHAEINRDRNLRLQYLAGMGLNLYQEALIYDQMVVYRKYPEELFIASAKSKQALKKAIEPVKN
jgi:spermidine synthase